MNTLYKYIGALLIFLFLSMNISAQNSKVKIGLEIDTSHSVLFGAPLDSAGYRMVWHPKKAALLVGTPFFASDWDIDSIGEGSFSLGSANIPYGLQSTALGFGNRIDRSTLFCTAFGFLNNISGDAIHSIVGGESNTTSASSSVVFGSNNMLSPSAFSSFATGTGNMITGNHSVVHGQGNKVNSNHSLVIGSQNETNAKFTTTNGSENKLNGLVSTAFGENLITKGSMSMVIGSSNDTTLQFQDDQSGTLPTPETPLFVVGNGTSNANRSNALSVFASGFVKIGSDTAVADLHIKQSVHANEVTSAGIRLENSFDNEYWQIYASGQVLSFGRYGNQVAYISEDGSYVDNTMLLKEENDEKAPREKSKRIMSFEKLEFTKKQGKRSAKPVGAANKIDLSQQSIVNNYPELLKYDKENEPIAIDKDQLLIQLLAKTKDHENTIQKLTKALERQEKLVHELMEP